MNKLKYTVIKSKGQYKEYCIKLEELASDGNKRKQHLDEIDLLTLLIEKYDIDNNTLDNIDPIKLLQSFMDEHAMKAKDLAELLNVNKAYVSDILNYKKGLSKDVIRKLADKFKVNQEAFNRPYKLKSEFNQHLKNASVMNTKKELTYAHS